MKIIYLSALILFSIVCFFNVIGYIASVFQIAIGRYDEMKKDLPQLPSKTFYIFEGLNLLAKVIVLYYGWILYLYY